MTEKTRSFICALGLISITIIWGFAFVVVKNSVDYIPPIYMLAFRFTIASVVLALIFLSRLKKMYKSTFFHGTGARTSGGACGLIRGNAKNLTWA